MSQTDEFLMADRDSWRILADLSRERAERAEEQLRVAVMLGDRMQSEGSRMAEYLDQAGAQYEVQMAACQFRSDVEAWTRLRTGASSAV